MLNKKSTHILFFLVIFIFINFLIFSAAGEESVAPSVSSEQADQTDPVDSEIMEEMIEPDSGERYTDLDFSNLSDEEKRNIYFNEPHLLPENFNLQLYMHIFHPETEETEN